MGSAWRTCRPTPWRSTLQRTHPIEFGPDEGEISAPLSLDPGIDVKKTTFFSRMVRKVGKSSAGLAQHHGNKEVTLRLHRLRGLEYVPLIQPGALITIDDSRRKIQNSGWSNEFERPIYFMEHRTGYACCWCTLSDDHLVLQPHPASLCPPQVYKYSAGYRDHRTGNRSGYDSGSERRRNIRS